MSGPELQEEGLPRAKDVKGNWNQENVETSERDSEIKKCRWGRVRPRGGTRTPSWKLPPSGLFGLYLYN
jgi:hypothetical protein